MKRNQLYLVIASLAVLLGVGGYFVWKNFSADDTPKVIIDKVAIYTKGENNDDLQSDAYKIGEIWIEDGKIVYEIADSAEDVISYIEDNKADWEENGISYDTGSCDGSVCWDGKVSAVIGDADFINGIYANVYDEFVANYRVIAVSR